MTLAGMRAPNDYDHQRSRPHSEVERVLHAMRELVRERDLQHADAQAELERLKSKLAGAVRRALADGRAG
jgi:hypothetical protein